MIASRHATEKLPHYWLLLGESVCHLWIILTKGELSRHRLIGVNNAMSGCFINVNFNKMLKKWAVPDSWLIGSHIIALKWWHSYMNKISQFEIYSECLSVYRALHNPYHITDSGLIVFSRQFAEGSSRVSVCHSFEWWAQILLSSATDMVIWNVRRDWIVNRVIRVLRLYFGWWKRMLIHRVWINQFRHRWHRSMTMLAHKTVSYLFEITSLW